MPKDMAKVLNACQKAVGIVFTEGSNTPAQARDIASGRGVLLSIIVGLAKEDPATMRYVEPALNDLHTQAEYSVDMMIRDIADVCLTLSRLADGKTRTERIKLAEATLLCQHLRDELRGIV